MNEWMLVFIRASNSELGKQVCVPLGAMLKGFPPRDRLHPFEQALLVLTVGSDAYERHQNRVDQLRRSTLQVRRQLPTTCLPHPKALDSKLGNCRQAILEHSIAEGYSGESSSQGPGGGCGEGGGRGV